MWPATLTAVAIATALLVRARTLRGRSRRAWGDAAGRLGTMGIRFDEGLQTLGGVLDGVTVGVSVQGHGGGRHTRIAATTDAPAGFELRRRETAAEDVPEITGDAVFDAAVAVEGPRVAGTAILDAPMRARIAKAVELGVRLEKGEVVVRRPGAIADGAALALVVRVVADLARRLADAHREDRVARLVAVATSDPIAGVRKRALRVLIDHYASDPQASSALDRALVDADAEVRLLGASGVGPAGFDAIRHIANDTHLPAAVRADALEKPRGDRGHREDPGATRERRRRRGPARDRRRRFRGRPGEPPRPGRRARPDRERRPDAHPRQSARRVTEDGSPESVQVVPGGHLPGRCSRADHWLHHDLRRIRGTRQRAW